MRRWPESVAAVRRTHCCMEHHGVDGGDGAGGVMAVVAAAAAADGDQRPTNRVAAYWTVPSVARTMDAEPLAAAAAETAPVPTTRAVV